MARKLRGEPVEESTDDVLGDISLNAFGLVMIILLVCIILFSNMTNASQKTASQPSSPESKPTRRDTIRKQEILKTLEEQVLQVKKRNELVGMWALRIHVTRLVSSRFSQASDEYVEYYIWIHTKDEKVMGTMFGARRDGKPCMNFAKLNGKSQGNDLTLEFHFTGEATGSSEIAYLRLANDRLVGNLVSGKQKSGFSNFEGPVEGRRINGSLFEETKS